jgi:hypothetical protein
MPPTKALPKAARADLHAGFASWLEDHGTVLVELDELLGYHLEQAVRYRRELGGDDEELAASARERLTSAGRHEQAAEALEEALARYEAKENLVMADRLRDRLAALRT